MTLKILSKSLDMAMLQGDEVLSGAFDLESDRFKKLKQQRDRFGGI